MARKNKQRVDLAQGDDTLTDNPFASLGNLVPDAPDQKDAAPKAEIVKPDTPFTVARTRKGGWPIHIEKRGGGKVVTIVDSISGDGKALLKALQKSLGTGGKLDGDSILIQGDHVAHVEAFLNEHLAQ